MSSSRLPAHSAQIVVHRVEETPRLQLLRCVVRLGNVEDDVVTQQIRYGGNGPRVFGAIEYVESDHGIEIERVLACDERLRRWIDRPDPYLAQMSCTHDGGRVHVHDRSTDRTDPCPRPLGRSGP